jgi:hypothetical protein
MNIALLFFGRIRFYDLHRETFSKLIRDNRVDVFLATNPELNADISGFIKLYNPVSVINKPNIKLEVDFKEVDFNKFVLFHPVECVKNVLPQYCNRKRVSELLEEYITNNGKKYDLVILHRLDIPGSQIDFKNMEKNDNVVYIPDGHDYNGYNDRMLISTPNGMKLACSLYDNVIQYLEDRCTYHPETLHKWHLDKCGFTVRRFQYNTVIRR